MHRAFGAYADTTPARGDDATLVARHASIVDNQARRLVRRTGCADLYDDFRSVGTLALLDAVRRFEAGRGATFETFAEHRVRGAMLDELRRLDHLPRRLRQETSKLQRAKTRLAGQYGRDPTTAEVAAALSLEIEEVAELELLCEPHASVPAELPDTGGDPLTRVTESERREAVTTAVAELDERLQLVLSLHYVEGLTYREIAGILNVSEPRVCQLHKRALDLMRGRLSEWNDDT